jgi:hypothetical protein
MEKELSSRRTVLHDLFSTGHQGSSNYLSFINSGVVLPQHSEHPGFSIFLMHWQWKTSHCLNYCTDLWWEVGLSVLVYQRKEI